MKSMLLTLILTLLLNGCAFSNSGMLSTESTIGNGNTNTKTTTIYQNKEAINILKQEIKNTNTALNAAFNQLGLEITNRVKLEKKIARLQQKVNECRNNVVKITDIQKELGKLEKYTANYIQKIKNNDKMAYQPIANWGF